MQGINLVENIIDKSDTKLPLYIVGYLRALSVGKIVYCW